MVQHSNDRTYHMFVSHRLKIGLHKLTMIEYYFDFHCRLVDCHKIDLTCFHLKNIDTYDLNHSFDVLTSIIQTIVTNFGPQILCYFQRLVQS
jgi:hypothetical protein